MEIIIPWLKRKHPIGGCAVHPDEHCFFNKLGHWILDPYKLLIWAIEIVSPFPRIPHRYKIKSTTLQKRRKTTGTRPPILDPAFLDDMAEEPEVIGTAPTSRDATVASVSVQALTLPYNPQAPVMQPPTAPWPYPHYPVHGVYPGVSWPAWPPQYYFPPPYPYPTDHR